MPDFLSRLLRLERGLPPPDEPPIRIVIRRTEVLGDGSVVELHRRVLEVPAIPRGWRPRSRNPNAWR
jgi:hypothetical protein